MVFFIFSISCIFFAESASALVPSLVNFDIWAFKFVSNSAAVVFCSCWLVWASFRLASTLANFDMSSEFFLWSCSWVFSPPSLISFIFFERPSFSLERPSSWAFNLLTASVDLSRSAFIFSRSDLPKLLADFSASNLAMDSLRVDVSLSILLAFFKALSFAAATSFLALFNLSNSSIFAANSPLTFLSSSSILLDDSVPSALALSKSIRSFFSLTSASLINSFFSFSSARSSTSLAIMAFSMSLSLSWVSVLFESSRSLLTFSVLFNSSRTVFIVRFKSWTSSFNFACNFTFSSWSLMIFNVASLFSFSKTVFCSLIWLTESPLAFFMVDNSFSTFSTVFFLSSISWVLRLRLFSAVSSFRLLASRFLLTSFSLASMASRSFSCFSPSSLTCDFVLSTSLSLSWSFLLVAFSSSSFLSSCDWK